MNATVARVLDTARSHVGLRSYAQKQNPFGASVGHNGNAWAGSFLERVMRDAGVLTLPALTSTVAALAEFHRTGRIFPSPRPGDLVFYAFSTDGDFSQPHIGLITDTSNWRTARTFKAIEGQTASGMRKGPQEEDGVYERTRREVDVLAFARPRYLRRAQKSRRTKTNAPVVQLHQVMPGKANRSVLYVQRALAETVGATGMLKGNYDDATQAAMRRYQLKIGYTLSQATGLPTVPTLQRLASETRYAYLRAPEA